MTSNNYVETATPVIEILSEIHNQGHSLNRVFSDWLNLMLTALQREDETYEEICQQYDKETVKKFANAFGEIQFAMSNMNHDLLGVVYEHLGMNVDAFGQHFTPHTVCDAKAEMAGILDHNSTDSGEPTSIADPACGSGRLLVSAAKAIPERQHVVFYGMDKDPICAKMTALNFTFFNMDGIVIHGNALTDDAYQGWKTCSSSLGGDISRIANSNLQDYHFSANATAGNGEPQRKTLKTSQLDLSEF